VLRELDPGTLAASGVGGGEGVFRRGNVNVAAGMLAARLRISVDEALVRLRALAFSRQRRITAIAQDIIAGDQFDADADVG
jgi:AmiR/NasT family two-component response regulator